MSLSGISGRQFSSRLNMNLSAGEALNPSLLVTYQLWLVV